MLLKGVDATSGRGPSRTSGLPPSFVMRISERGARIARREERANREFVSDEQRSEPGCPARKLHYK